MNVGYYYHAPGVADGDGVRLPGVVARFVNELASQAGRVTCYVHTGPDTGVEDDRVGGPGVRVVDLGALRSGPARAFRPSASLRRFLPGRDGVDAMLVRGPSPLVPHLLGACRDVPAALLLVGDYATWFPGRTNGRLRNLALRGCIPVFARQQDAAARGRLVLVKSPALLRGRAKAYERTAVVFTTSMHRAELDLLAAIPRPVEPLDGSVRLLYTGRIVEEKGLYEAVEATALLKRDGIHPHLRLVGSAGSDPTLGRLRRLAGQLGVLAQIEFAGYVPPGAALHEEYRRADVFVFPTYGEGGLARSLQEAFAAGLPAVTTAVRAHEGVLTDGIHALLVEPRSPRALAEGIGRLVRDDRLRGDLGAGARRLVATQSMERSVGLILEHLEALAGRR